MALVKRRLTLLEAAVLACIIGIVLAVFVPTFVRELHTSKLAEAETELARLSIAATAYSATTPSRGCIPEAAGPTPAEPNRDPVQVVFAEEAGGTTWRAIEFEPQAPIRFRYSLVADAPGCGAAAGTPVILRAEGDLDGDGELSTFERRLVIGESGMLEPDGVLHVERRVE